MMDIIKSICIIVGGCFIGIILACFMVFIIISIYSYLKSLLEKKENRKNGNLHITVDKNWKKNMSD